MKWNPYITLLVCAFVVSAAGSTIYGWGKNDNGQLGINNYNDPVTTITQISFYSTLSITSISVGENTHFATAGNNFYSCGSNSNGQLGQGTTAPSYAIPTLISGLSGNYTIFALPKATIVYSPPQKTISGCGYAAGYVRGLSIGNYYKLQPVLPDFGFAGKIENLYTANGCSFVQLTNGSIFSAGISPNGVFGLGTNASSPSYQQMTFWDSEQVDFLKIYSTQSSTVCAQAVNLSIYCWGSNSAGQLGIGHLDDAYEPTLVKYFDDLGLWISQLKQGIMHSIALTCSGRVFTWGANQRGQLGIGTSDLDFHSTPIELVALRNQSIVYVVTGGYHNFARTANNEWFFWGMGDTAVSGLGATEYDILFPTKVPQFKDLGITRIESGSYSLFAIGVTGDADLTAPTCPPGWNIDECNPANSADFPCGPNMNCTDMERSYICTCKPGYMLEQNNSNACEDINECLQNPCIPQATCNNTIGSFFCDCPPGFTGDGLRGGKGCVPTVCGNGIVEKGEECDTRLSPSCCNASCFLEPAGFICRNTTVPCDHTEYCDGIGQLCPPDDWTAGTFCDYCGNGQCNNNTESCSTCPQDCGTCDACTGFLCYGKCAQSLIDCVVQCLPTEFACASGVCVTDFTNCATHNCTNKTECWDGSCTTALSLCPLVPACPILSRRCYGRCIGVNEACEIEVQPNCTDPTPQVCLDGQCANECAQYNGCPTGLIRCPNGACASDVATCKGNCPGDFYLCADKTCNLPDNCTVLLRFEAAIPFAQRISPSKNSTVDVLSTSGIPIVALQLLAGTFGQGKNSTSLNVAPVSFSSLKQVPLPARWNNSDLESNMFASAVAFTTPENKKFAKYITVKFNGEMPSHLNISDLCLGYINASGCWDCASDIEYVNGTFIGNTSHFTPFSVIKSIRPPKFNTLSKDDLSAFTNINVNSVIIYVYCGLIIIFSVLFIWAFHADREEKKKLGLEDVLKTEEYEYEEETRTPQSTRKSITLFRPETPSSSPSGVLSASSSSQGPSRLSGAPLILSASTGSAPSSPYPLANSASPAPSSSDAPSPSPSSPSPAPSTFADGEMSVEPPPGNGPRGRPRARTLVMKEQAQTRFTTKHKWLSIYFTARIENLPRVSRVVILLCMILTNMTVAALLYNDANRQSIAQRILVGIISSLISFVCSFSIFMMFKLVNKKYRPICYAVSTIYVLGTGFITLWLNLKIEQSVAYGWCISSAIGIVQDAFINEPAKIIVISLLIAFCPFIPMVHKL